VREVPASQLFMQPSGNMIGEYKRLLSGIKSMPASAGSDWHYRQQCITKWLALKDLRSVSKAHALVADCWAQAVTALDRCLYWPILREWNEDAVHVAVARRARWIWIGQNFAHLADGLLNDIARMHTAAANSDATGRWEAGQMWREAADMQLRIALRSYERMVGALPEIPIMEDSAVLHMQTFVSKFTHLAQRLDNEPVSEEGQCNHVVTSTDLLMCSAIHCKFNCDQQILQSSQHVAACVPLHSSLQILYDTILSGMVRANWGVPIAEKHTRLVECSALLVEVTERSDLTEVARNEALQFVKHSVDSIRPVFTGTSATHCTEDATKLAQQLSIANTQAGQAVLMGNHKSKALFTAAAEQYEKAAKLLLKTGPKNGAQWLYAGVADRVVDLALSKGATAVGTAVTSATASTGLYQSVTDLCANEIRQIGRLLDWKAELEEPRAAAGLLEDRVRGKKACDLYNEAGAAYQRCVDTQYKQGLRRLAHKAQICEKTYYFEGLQSFIRTEVSRQCAVCLRTAASALMDPEAPPTLSHCLEGVARFRKVGLAAGNGIWRVSPSELWRWFRHAAAALRTGYDSELSDAWIQAAEKGQEVYEAEDRGVDVNQLSAGADVAFCLRDIAVSLAQHQTQIAMQQQVLLVQLRIVEQCVISLAGNVSTEERARLNAVVDAADNRMTEIKRAQQEAGVGGDFTQDKEECDAPDAVATDAASDPVAGTEQAFEEMQYAEDEPDSPLEDCTCSVLTVDSVSAQSSGDECSVVDEPDIQEDGQLVDREIKSM
jgi:hypothetical protein